MSSIPLPDRELTTIDGGVVVTRRPLAYLHGLYDRPRCHATSSDDLVRAAVPYFAVLGVLPTEMPPVAEVHTLPREWVGRVRAKRNLWVWDLTERGRGIVERTVPALMIGVGSYRGLRALRESDERKRRGEPEPSESDAVVQPEVEVLAFAWRLTTSPGSFGGALACEHNVTVVRAFANQHLLKHGVLPFGTHLVSRIAVLPKEVNFDRLHAEIISRREDVIIENAGSSIVFRPRSRRVTELLVLLAGAGAGWRDGALICDPSIAHSVIRELRRIR